MTAPLHTFIHVITPQAVDLEVALIEAALHLGAYDPTDLDFTRPAMQRLVGNAINAASEVGNGIYSRGWLARSDGGIDVVIEAATEQSLVAAKLALS